MKESIEKLLYNPRTSSFLGYSMQQCWADLAVWEKFLNKREIRSFIELGTGHCGMSLYLLFQCLERDILFHTFDINEGSEMNRRLTRYIDLLAYFHKADILTHPHFVYHLANVLPKPLVLFCDNGDKPKEFELFVPHLQVGDYVVVHDWLQEINESDVGGFPIEPVMHEECEEWRSITRFWRIS